MGKKEEKFQSELDRANLEKSFYEMVYLQGLSVKDVAKKYGFSRQTVYVYLRNISEYKVSPRFVKTCESSKDFPHHTATVASYSEGNSPVKFKNYIAYSFYSDCRNLQHIDNSFYVCGVTNYSKKAAVEKVREKTDCYSNRKEKHEYFKIGGPNKFYRTYYRQGLNGDSEMFE